MWNDTTFNVNRREISTSRPFDEVVAAIENVARRVVPEFNATLLGEETVEDLAAGRIDSDELTSRIEDRLGSSGFLLLMKVEHDVLMSHLGRKHRSVQYAIGNPLRAKDVSDAAPGAALYTPLRIAVIENEEDGSTSILFDSAESLMGSFGSDVAREIGRSLDQKLVGAAEQAVHVEAAEEAT
jgi:uncharacterized protein (DUF302 family)